MNRSRNIFIVIVCLLFISNTKAQTKADKKAAKVAALRAMIKNQDFDFVAQYATPQGGGQVVLTTTYDLVVKKDSLIAFLPYFGRAYFDVPYNPTDGGIKFTSTKFSYTIADRKDGGYTIKISPADIKYYQQITIWVSQNGYATASFVITNKSFISFNGYVTENKKPKK